VGTFEAYNYSLIFSMIVPVTHLYVEMFNRHYIKLIAPGVKVCSVEFFFFYEFV
jgi:hypothetical protein